MDYWLIDQLERTKALQKGHFLLSSGRHSQQYVQCAKFTQHPDLAKIACMKLSVKVTESVDVVIGPALGGILVAHELASALGVLAMFTERINGEMSLRRGFELDKGTRVLIAEDVVTTGKSANEVINLVTELGSTVVGVASLINRSEVSNPFNVPWFYQLKLEIPSFDKKDCPECLYGLENPLVKPGSRHVF